ncbi:hypothetical protein INS49_014401 [Diaporthe citri]|uniref:uncharacterized protein n=1 Tax=Diaporthe citri TaxID=83186 RepID=UPI001C818F25|nr:uncharacterized protein INS49_014401 [Diaporthe citri]KAG6358517.1 hypothetical protein INS49_014401 [Diaporthe citri]
MKGAAILNAFIATAVAAPRQHHGSLLRRADRDTSIVWAGGVVRSENITAVTGTFRVIRSTLPTVSEPGKHAYSASAWIGIGGYTKVRSGTRLSMNCILILPVFLDIGNIPDGDTIKVSLGVLSSTQANVDLENQSTGKGFSQTTNITHPICQKTAEWIVERSYILSGLVGLIDFGTETIDNIAYTASDESHTTVPDDVILVDIVNDEAKNTIQTHTKSHEGSIQVTFHGS